MITIHPLSPEDVPAAAAMREATAAHKGDKLGPDARPMFDGMFAATPAAPAVQVEAASVGGVAGFRVRPADARPGSRLLYIHGGGYVLGSAQAFTSFVGQIARRAGAASTNPFKGA